MSNREYLKLIDTSTKGRYDVSPLFANSIAFRQLIDDLSEKISFLLPTKICGIDALGFILGVALAQRLNIGFVPVRKAGKLPSKTDKEYFIDYSGIEKGLELRSDILNANDRVIIVDDWVETGTQVLATIKLVRHQGASIVGVAAINFDSTDGVRSIKEQIPCISLWENQ